MPYALFLASCSMGSPIVLIVPWLLNVNSPKIVDPFPYQETVFYKLENSIQTYVNYYKTHAMATHYGGIGDTSMENPET